MPVQEYEISAEVKFTIHWICPAKSPAEVIMRDMAQVRLDEKAFAIAEGLKTLAQLTTIMEQQK